MLEMEITMVMNVNKFER
ncbi:unnamed protein product [Cuscuta epithymum]|nr:unnamed protein product [Cuscuta epithymum]CAH9142086.1 unnamed protein product [Cuscuta epithymum]